MIFPDEYDSDIVSAITNIKLEAQRRLSLDISDEDIGVFNIDGTIFVIGNPVLYTIEYRDKEGNLYKDEKRNVTIEYWHPSLTTTTKKSDGLLWEYCLESHLVVFYRFLLAKIRDGQVIFG